MQHGNECTHGVCAYIYMLPRVYVRTMILYIISNTFCPSRFPRNEQGFVQNERMSTPYGRVCVSVEIVCVYEYKIYSKI